MRKVRIAQIGFNENSHSPQVFESLTKQTDLFEVVGYVLPEGERERVAHRMAVTEGYPELTLGQVLNDPTIEAVTVETDEIYLTKYALLAVEHGKHVHMEKPGGTDPTAFAALIEAVKVSGKVLHTGYMYRYNPFVQDILQQVKSGDLGEILSVEAQMNCTLSAEIRQWLSTFEGGMLFYLGCHLIDLILQIQGDPLRVIPLNKCTGTDGVTAQDFGMAVLEYDHGVSFAKTSACERGGYLRRQLVVTGTKGTVELKPFEVPVEGGQYTARTVWRDTDWFVEGDIEKSPIHDRYDGMMAAFAAMVRGERENPYTPDYEWKLYKTLLQACGKDV